MITTHVEYMEDAKVFKWRVQVFGPRGGKIDEKWFTNREAAMEWARQQEDDTDSLPL